MSAESSPTRVTSLPAVKIPWDPLFALAIQVTVVMAWIAQVS